MTKVNHKEKDQNINTILIFFFFVKKYMGNVRNDWCNNEDKFPVMAANDEQRKL